MRIKRKRKGGFWGVSMTDPKVVSKFPVNMLSKTVQRTLSSYADLELVIIKYA